MIRATRTLPAGSFDAATAIDSVHLDFDDRRRRRATFTGAGGTAFHVDLETAPTLVEGDGFVLETGGIVLIKGKQERLVEFRSDDPHVITRVAWHLGNRHTPTQLLDRALRIRDDYVLVELVKKLGAEVAFVTAVFQPEGGAYGLGSVTGHDHHDDEPGHAHKHDDHGHAHHGHHDHDHKRHHVEADVSEEDRMMAETIARRDARRAARAAEVHVHGPDCGHEHHGHDHAHADDHDHAHHDHAHEEHAHRDHGHGHGHDHHHNHGHAHGAEDHDHH